jgi:transcriptional regulator
VRSCIGAAGGAFRIPSSHSIPVDNQHQRAYLHVEIQQERPMSSKSDVLQGTLDLMVLKTLETLGPMHGYGIARRIEQVSDDALQLNQGTLYPALVRLEQRGWITSKWGLSDNNRRARYYELTKAGRKQLRSEAASWERMAAIVARFLEST